MNDSTKQFNKMNKEYGQFKQVKKKLLYLKWKIGIMNCYNSISNY